MDIRPARPADAEAIRDVARESWHAAYGDFLSAQTIDETIDAWYASDALREQLDRGAFYVAVADDGGSAENDDVSDTDTDREGANGADADGDVVAFAQATIDADGTRPTLRRLYARESYWGSGVGTQLLDAVVNALGLGEHHDSVSAVVFAENDVGRAFYRTHGFEEVDRRTESFDSTEHEELILRRSLSDLPDDRDH